MPLFERSFPATDVVARRDPPDPATAAPDIDFHTPGGGLARWLRPSQSSFSPHSGYLRAEQLMQGFWRRMEEMGQEFNPYQGAFAQQICVAENMAEAQRIYEPHVRYFFEHTNQARSTLVIGSRRSQLAMW